MNSDPSISVKCKMRYLPLAFFIVVCVFSPQASANDPRYLWTWHFPWFDQLGQRLEIPIIVITTSDTKPPAVSWKKAKELMADAQLGKEALLDGVKAIFPTWEFEDLLWKEGRTYLEITTFQPDELQSLKANRIRENGVQLPAFEGTYLELFRLIEEQTGQCWQYESDQNRENFFISYGKRPEHPVRIATSKGTIENLFRRHLLDTTEECRGVLLSVNYMVYHRPNMVECRVGFGPHAISAYEKPSQEGKSTKQ